MTSTEREATGTPAAVDVRAFVRWIVADYEPSVRTSDEAGSYGTRPGARLPDLYGVADLACVLHTIGRLRLTDQRRREWDEQFAAFQDPLSGHYVEKGKASHVELHCTAFAVAAMELVGLEPRNRLGFADGYRSPRAVTGFLDTLDWRQWVYLESHRGSGLGAVFAIVPGFRTRSWFDAYFEFLDGKVDPANGMLGDDKPPEGDLDQLGGTFHYLFLYEAFHRRLPHGPQRIDAVLGLQDHDGIWDPDNALWLTLDGIYTLTRSLRHTGHRRDDVVDAVRRAVAWVASEVLPEDRRDQWFDTQMGTHDLVAAVSLLAEAQAFLGADEVLSDEPLRLVLDRRPFI